METAFGMKTKRTSCLQLMSLPTLKEQVWLMLSRNTEITGLRENIFLINIKGTDGNGILEGTHFSDKFSASLGHDLIKGGAGDDSIDYTEIDGPITLRFDGVLKGSNVIDELGLSAWESLQNLASQGNNVARKIFSLHTNFFGNSPSGFFGNSQHSDAAILIDDTQDAATVHGFDRLQSIESIEANTGSSIDGRGATEAVDINLKANRFRTNFFGHTMNDSQGFSNVLGSRNNDIIKGDGKNNVLLGLAGFFCKRWGWR